MDAAVEEPGSDSRDYERCKERDDDRQDERGSADCLSVGVLWSC